MPKYSYTAKKQDGKIQTGLLSSKDVFELRQMLEKQGLELIIAKPQGGKIGISLNLPFFKRVSLVDKLMFTRNLQVMVASGLSVPKALDILSQQTKNKFFGESLEKISESIVKGDKFSDALSKHKKIFSDLYCNMIALGEESGNLDKVLKDLAFQMEKEHNLKSKIKGAMMYPSVIICAMLLIGMLIIIFVVPKLKATFDSLNVDLPKSTKIILNLGNTLSSPIFLAEFFGGAILLFFSIRAINKTKSGKKFFDSMIMRTPVVGQIVKKSNVANIIGTLSTLLSSGLPIVKSLEIISKTTNNIFFKESLMESAKEIQKGSKLSDILMKYKDIYSLTVVQMINIGEETGETSDILKKLADFYQEEVVRSAENISTVIEPVLMLIVGGAVAFFAVAMFSPIYSMFGAIQ
ncbi:MAG TPA: type II secretion system F family protein [Candidatus Pacearchaeota archaeon]|nr:type II secretion system F family protein [Candidatus Pacearchaeota archaeon]HQI74766.1 type II secretion system F family protein [Candidatus Pacearchaeota archaeon]